MPDPCDSENLTTSICEACGAENTKDANFCRMCATKLNPVCNCWVKKEPYNCGQDQCPGHRLLLAEMAIDQAKSTNGISDHDAKRLVELLNANYEGKPDIIITYRTDQSTEKNSEGKS